MRIYEMRVDSHLDPAIHEPPAMIAPEPTLYRSCCVAECHAAPRRYSIIDDDADSAYAGS